MENEKLIIDVNITTKLVSLKDKAKDAKDKNTAEEVEEVPEEETSASGKLYQTGRRPGLKDEPNVKNRPLEPILGMGWIAQFCTDWVAEYVFCTQNTFRIWCSDCSKYVDLVFNNLYNTGADGADIRYRAVYYDYFGHVIFPVKSDTFIIYIYALPIRDNAQNNNNLMTKYLPIKEHTILIGPDNIKEIQKPTKVTWQEILQVYPDSKHGSGFVYYSDNDIVAPTPELLKRKKDIQKNITNPENSEYWQTCGFSESTKFHFFGNGRIKSGFDTSVYDNGYTVLLGGANIYSLLLGKPQGSAKYAAGTYGNYGMKTPPIRLSTKENSIWTTVPGCSKPTPFYSTASTATGYFNAYPDYFYGYAVSAPSADYKYKIDYMKVNPYGEDSAWWKYFPDGPYFASINEMSDSYWRQSARYPKSNKAISPVIQNWATQQPNTGYTGDWIPGNRVSFSPILSYSWGRDWTAQLLELGFSKDDLSFKQQ